MITVLDVELLELRSRLLDTRWPPRWLAGGWDAGTDPGELQRLVA